MAYALDAILCVSCGTPVYPTGRGDLDDEHCDKCNDRYYAAMAAEFPYGQCGQCGAAGTLLLCPAGKQHVVFFHVEGACSQWSDGPGWDEYGCPMCAASTTPPPSFDSVDLGYEDLPF